MSDVFGASDRLLVRLAANTVVHAAGTGFGSLISFFTFVAVARGLGPDSYGDYTASLAFITIPVVLVDIGLSTAVVRYLAGDPDRTERVIRTTVPIRALATAAVVAAIIGVAAVAPFSDQTKLGILIGSLGAVALLVTGTVFPLFQVRLSLQWVVLANLAGRIVTLALTLAALSAGYGFEGVVWANVAGLWGAALLALAAASRFTSLRPIVDLGESRRMVAGAVALALAVGLAQVYMRLDAVLLALLRTEYEVGIYGAAWKFIDVAGFAAGAVSVTVLPALSRFAATNDPRLRTMASRALDVMLAAGVPVAVLLGALAPEIIRLTAGAEFREGATALRILAAYVPMMFVTMLLWNIIIARGADRTLLKLGLATVVANVALNLALIPAFGYRGAASAALGSEALSLFLGLLAVHRLQALPSVGYLRVVLPASLLMALVLVAFPGPAAVTAVAAVAVYGAVIALAPGTGRDAVQKISSTVRTSARA